MLIECASARRHQCLERLKFYWITEEVLVLVCTLIKETWSCDGGWHKTWQLPPSERVKVCSTTSSCQGFIVQALSHMFPLLEGCPTN